MQLPLCPKLGPLSLRSLLSLHSFCGRTFIFFFFFLNLFLERGEGREEEKLDV